MSSRPLVEVLSEDLPAPREVRVGGNRLRLFVETPQYIEALVADLGQAKQRAWVEVYIFADDAAGRAVAEALIRCAQSGVDTRLLYDAFGSQSTPRGLFEQMRAAGVKVHAFHTLWYALRRWRFFEIMNRRNHRKLAIVDEQAAYFGGMNLCDPHEPVPTGISRSDPAESRWRDVHVRMSGPQVEEVAESFERNWKQAQHEKVPLRPRAYRRARLPAGVDDCIRFFDSGPGLRHSRATRVFQRLIRRSRSRITLSMAYFIPTPNILRALLYARRRGSHIRVIVPGLSDVNTVRRALRYLYGRLLRRGIGIYERQHRMLHSKVMVVDDLWSVVGSCNLDPRSLRYNLEFLAVIRSPSLAFELNRICREELRESVRITRRSDQERSTWDRVLDRLAYAFRWWL